MDTNNPQRAVAISGTGGMIGGKLSQTLQDEGWSVRPLVRSRDPERDDNAIAWPTDTHALDPAALEGLDTVVHLAGENIVGWWTNRKKQAIRESRVPRTRSLARTLAALRRPPQVFICASAIGYYGNRGDETLTEQSPPGEGFLAQIAVEWEAATAPAHEAGIRTVNLRLGVVLSPEGGALAKALPVFKVGGGGTLGDGSQWWSWITLADVVGAIRFAIEDPKVHGPVNLTTPEPVTNRQFTKALGSVLKRPTILPVPASALRLTMGEMADEMLLSSARVLPTQLEQAGYRFTHPQLEPALREMVG